MTGFKRLRKRTNRSTKVIGRPNTTAKAPMIRFFLLVTIGIFRSKLSPVMVSAGGEVEHGVDDDRVIFPALARHSRSVPRARKRRERRSQVPFRSPSGGQRVFQTPNCRRW